MALRTTVWAGFTAIIASLIGSICVAQSPARTFAPNVVAQEIKYAVRTNPALRGAWLHVDFVETQDAAIGEGTFRFTRVMDQAHVSSQTRELDALIRKWVPQGNYVVVRDADTYYPFSELLALIQDWIEFNPRLGGCLVEDGYYVEDPKSDELVLNVALIGRIANDSQRADVEATCASLMRTIPGWVHGRTFATRSASAKSADELNSVALAINPTAGQLSVVQPNWAAGLTFWEDGYRSFRKGLYSEASRSFQQAVVEAPEKLDFRYWRILSELAQGQSNRAYWQMQRVVAGTSFDRSSSDYTSLFHSLQRIQGPLRRQLSELETRAVFARGGRR